MLERYPIVADDFRQNSGSNSKLKNSYNSKKCKMKGLRGLGTKTLDCDKENPSPGIPNTEFAETLDDGQNLDIARSAFFNFKRKKIIMLTQIFRRFGRNLSYLRRQNLYLKNGSSVIFYKIFSLYSL